MNEPNEQTNEWNINLPPGPCCFCCSSCSLSSWRTAELAKFAGFSDSSHSTLKWSKRAKKKKIDFNNVQLCIVGRLTVCCTFEHGRQTSVTSHRLAHIYDPIAQSPDGSSQFSLDYGLRNGHTKPIQLADQRTNAIKSYSDEHTKTTGRMPHTHTKGAGERRGRKNKTKCYIHVHKQTRTFA